MTGWLRAWRGSRLGVAVAVLVAGAGSAASWLVGAGLTRSAQAATDESMTRRAATVRQLVADEIRRYVDAVGLLGNAVASQSDLRYSDFQETVAPLLDMHLPGATAVAYVGRPMSDAEVASQQAFWRGQGVTDLQLRKSGNGDHLFALMVQRLDDRPPVPPGFDYASLPAPNTALGEARSGTGVAVTDTYTLVADRPLPAEQRQNGFSLIAASRTGSGATEQFKGWVVLGVRAQDFMKQVLTSASRNLGTDIELYAQDAGRHTVQIARLAAPEPGRRTEQREVSVQMAQRVWTVQVAAPTSVLSAPSLVAGRLVQGTGIAISMLLGSLILLLSTARARARVWVQAATNSLRGAETDARRQSALLSSILDSTGEAIAVVDDQGHFVLMNSTGERLLGVGAESEGMDHWREHDGMFTPDGERPLPPDQIPLARALAGESVDAAEVLVRSPAHPDGLLISVSARPLDERAGMGGAVCSFRDITAERAHQAELVAFAGMVAHDLRNPLGVITSYTSLLLGGTLEDLKRDRGGDAGQAAADETELYVLSIQDCTKQMSELIHDLLEYTTTENATLELRRVDLGELAEEVASVHADRLAAAAAADPDGGIHVPQCYVGAMPAVQGDPVRLRQLLDNLIGNAIKYSPDDRPARVDVTAAARPDGLLEVTVADRGLGIPDGQHGKVFQRFFRVAEHVTRPGTGLGLAICHRIVQLHGGTIGALDNPGGGTRIVFTLPPAQRPDPSREASPQPMAHVGPPPR